MHFFTQIFELILRKDFLQCSNIRRASSIVSIISRESIFECNSLCFMSLLIDAIVMLNILAIQFIQTRGSSILKIRSEIPFKYIMARNRGHDLFYVLRNMASAQQ